MNHSTQNTDPRHQQTDHYNYELPKSLIAQQPLPNREDARLLAVDRPTGKLEHFHIRDLPDLLRPNDCLVLNNTKVIPARLVGFRVATRGRWQGLYLQADEGGLWKVLGKTRGNIKPGEQVILQDRQGVERFTLTLLAKLDGGAWMVKPDCEGTPQQLLDTIGRVPLPHYIRGGNMVDSDVADYQTVFASQPGAVAAPTAGLHLTNRLIRQLIDRHVSMAQVTLHVGIGTFRPVDVDQLDQHQMHFEWGSIKQPAIDAIERSRQAGGRTIAVGTTSVRVLETAALKAGDGEQVLRPWSGDTDLFIYPPWNFRAVDGLLTNFHLPRSTLLMMIRAFGGDKFMQRAYQEAVEEKYRFFSYGDAMLIT